MKRTAKAASVVAVSMAIAGLGIGAAQIAQADPTAAPTPSASATPGAADSSMGPQSHHQGGMGKGGRMGQGGMGQGMPGRGHDQMEQSMASELASKLGLDETKVKEALQAVRQEHMNNGGTRTPQADRQAEFAKALASKLGVDEAKVTKALDEIRSTHQAADSASREAALKSRLDQAVKDGKLTQAEADAVLKAQKAGVLGR